MSESTGHYGAGRTTSFPRLLAMVVVGMLLNPQRVTAEVSSSCKQDQVIRFAPSLQALADQLGPTMGDPLDCEYTDSDTGDLLQGTTAGLRRTIIPSQHRDHIRAVEQSIE
jgi:hypothetical protein